MLALTENAVELVEAIVREADVPESAVLRITRPSFGFEDGGEGDGELQLSIAIEPDEDDLRVGGVPVTVDSQIVEFLDDKVLDANIGEDGVEFRLFERPAERADEEVLTSRNGHGPETYPH